MAWKTPGNPEDVKALGKTTVEESLGLFFVHLLFLLTFSTSIKVCIYIYIIGIYNIYVNILVALENLLISTFHLLECPVGGVLAIEELPPHR